MTAIQHSFHPTAIEEAEAAARWYRERSPRAAKRFVLELNLVIDRILDAPLRWPQGPHGTRKAIVPYFPFSVIYWESPNNIRILAVAHGRRRPGYWKDRL
jgi:plasmid stabilization system protein ParE